MAHKRNTNTIQKIKTSMIKLLNEKPLQKITINDICNYASINRSTFYLHYHDQFELYEKLKEEILDELLTYINKSFVSGEYSPIESFLNSCKENDMVKTFFVSSERHKFYEDLKKSVYPIIFQKTNDILDFSDRDYVYSFILDGSSSIISNWINNNCKESTEYIAKLIIKITSSVFFYNDNAIN